MSHVVNWTFILLLILIVQSYETKDLKRNALGHFPKRARTVRSDFQAIKINPGRIELRDHSTS